MVSPSQRICILYALYQNYLQVQNPYLQTTLTLQILYFYWLSAANENRKAIKAIVVVNYLTSTESLNVAWFIPCTACIANLELVRKFFLPQKTSCFFFFHPKAVHTHAYPVKLKGTKLRLHTHLYRMARKKTWIQFGQPA